MIVSKTPLRASFFGGGTDFYDYFHNSKYGYGNVISTTLGMYVYIVVNKRMDEKIRIVYWDNELVDDVNEIKHNIIREALKITNITSSIEIIYFCDLPMTNLGIGLASSSALAVGVLNALHRFKNEMVSKEQLAKEAIDLEINHLHQEIGIQDQYAVAYGGLNRFIFNKNNKVDVIPLAITDNVKEELNNHLMFFYTGNARDSRQIFKEQKETTKNHREILDFLVEATNTAYQNILNGDIDSWGDLLKQTWEKKKQFAKGVTDENINKMYDLALNNGALGGKILGAGGGGFLLLYVLPDKQENVRKALSNYKEVNFKLDSEGSRIVYQD